MNEPVAIIIAALIGAIGTFVASKFDTLLNLFKTTNRNISGTWEGKSYYILNPPNSRSIMKEKFSDDDVIGKYIVTIKQRGEKITGTMVETEVIKDWIKTNYHWNGKILSEYLSYSCIHEDKAKFLISNAILFIHPGGHKMTGYFIANAGADYPFRTWIGYAELTKQK